MKPDDLKNESYPGQAREEIPSASYRRDGDGAFEAPEAWLERALDPDPARRAQVRESLDSAADEEILEAYDRLRDERTAWDGGWYYPNTQTLFGTPLEREKDRREIRLYNRRFGESEVARWYREAKDSTCVWWLENHLVARHAIHSCMGCGNCASLCPAAEFFDYNPRVIVDIVQDKDEGAIVELLQSETLWYCSQCGSCKTKCPRENNPFALVSSLRQLAQIKGYHVLTVRGRQQYAARHLWGGNLWNRACTLFFRNAVPETHRDFGPRYEENFRNIETAFRAVGASPDMEGSVSGRKVRPETLDEVRRIWHYAGALVLWDFIEEAGRKQAEELGLSIDEYHDKVKTEG